MCAAKGKPVRSPPENQSPDPSEGVRRIGQAEAVSSLKNLAAGWKDEFAKELALPGTLFIYNEGNLLVLSGDEGLSALKFLPAMRSGGDPPKGIQAYGFIVYETSGSSYLVFVDTARGAVVKEGLSGFQSGSTEDWGNIVGLISEALKMAKPRHGLAVIDSVLGRKAVI